MRGTNSHLIQLVTSFFISFFFFFLGTRNGGNKTYIEIHIGNTNGLSVSDILPECTFLTSACTVVTQYLYMLLELRLYKQ